MLEFEKLLLRPSFKWESKLPEEESLKDLSMSDAKAYILELLEQILKTRILAEKFIGGSTNESRHALDLSIALIMASIFLWFCFSEKHSLVILSTIAIISFCVLIRLIFVMRKTFMDRFIKDLRDLEKEILVFCSECSNGHFFHVSDRIRLLNFVEKFRQIHVQLKVDVESKVYKSIYTFEYRGIIDQCRKHLS